MNLKYKLAVAAFATCFIAQNANADYCREYTSKGVVIAGEKQPDTFGTACRQPDGSWKIMSTGNAPAPVLTTAQPVAVYAPPPPPAQTVVYGENPAYGAVTSLAIGAVALAAVASLGGHGHYHGYYGPHHYWHHYGH